ncbi:response regulator transcription factor [Vibrio tritonius]|uniref:response regulator transcription factor n=1 Tax=Vibrio tritonius TaxID=1435069 RepID=UPI00315DC970
MTSQITTRTEDLTILIVEDEPIYLDRIKSILQQLGCQPLLVHSTSTLKEALHILPMYSWDYAFVDLGLPDGDGRQVIDCLHQSHPEAGITVISAWSDENTIFAALRAGATGYLLKERDDLEIMLGVRSTLRGGAPIDPFIAKRILQEIPASPSTEGESSDSPLSRREHEILSWVADGMSNKEIANHLTISRYTVETHVKSIYRKLAVSSRLSAVKAARESGLLR